MARLEIDLYLLLIRETQREKTTCFKDTLHHIATHSFPKKKKDCFWGLYLYLLFIGDRGKEQNIIMFPFFGKEYVAMWCSLLQYIYTVYIYTYHIYTVYRYIVSMYACIVDQEREQEGIWGGSGNQDR